MGERSATSAATIDAGARDVILAQEEALRYPERFGADEALGLGCALAAEARDFDRGVTAVITREDDGMVLFSWSMDDKAPRNAVFAEGKRAAARLCGHASLMCYVEHELDGGWAELFDALSAPPAPGATLVCPVGGAFPIRVGDVWVATLAVSGLHAGKDHELCVRALARALGRAYGAGVPAFRYPAI